jgi:hypothetical protein
MERLFDKVLVTGGAGYCGARLVPQMLARGYKVTVFDIMFFGNQFLPRDNPNLRIIDGDIRDTAKFAERWSQPERQELCGDVWSPGVTRTAPYLWASLLVALSVASVGEGGRSRTDRTA